MIDAAAFEASVAELLGRPLGAVETIAVAVSGGCDSVALLLLAHEAFGGRVRAVTVDHGLRAESAAESRHVASICERLGVPHVVLRWEGAKPAASLQAAARAARYRLMAAWCAESDVAWLATAHQADDVAETLLMRLARGSGLGGLAQMRAVRVLAPGVTLLRPLLGVRRAELAALAAPFNPIADPSNENPRFDRTQARALLRDSGWLAAERVAASAAHLREVETAVEWVVEQAWRGRAATDRAGVGLDAGGLPDEIVRRLVLRALRALSPEAEPRGAEVERAVAALRAGRGGTLAGVRFRAEEGLWRFSVAPARRPTAGGN